MGNYEIKLPQFVDNRRYSNIKLTVKKICKNKTIVYKCSLLKVN